MNNSKYNIDKLDMKFKDAEQDFKRTEFLIGDFYLTELSKLIINAEKLYGLIEIAKEDEKLDTESLNKIKKIVYTRITNDIEKLYKSYNRAMQ